MMEDPKDQKETQQLTGDKTNVGLVERAKETAAALKDRAIEEAKDYKDPQQTQVWKSIFRVSHERSDPRNRSLAILSNVFCTCIRPRSIAMRCAISTPGEWVESRFIFSSCSRSPASC